MKFLHIGDVHINKSFVTKDEGLSRLLKARLKKSFNNAVDYCIKNDLDALLIAGDLFDHYPVELDAKLTVIEAFKRLEAHQIMVLYCSGNHDPSGLNSPLLTMAFPENVKTFFDDQYQVHTLHDRSNQAYDFIGCGHIDAHETRPLLRDFPRGDYIGLVHANVTSGDLEEDKDYLPCDLKTLKDLDYKYLALGHIHIGGSLNDQATINYSGCLMGMNANETGKKGGYLVEIDPSGCRSTFVPLAGLTYETLDLDLRDVTTLDGCFDLILNEVRTSYQDQDQYSLSLYLRGKTSLYAKLKETGVMDQLRSSLLEYLDLVDIKLVDETRVLYDGAAYRRDNSVLGAVLESLDHLKTSGDLGTIQLLQAYSPQELEDLLDQMEDDLLTLFLEGYDEN